MGQLVIARDSLVKGLSILEGITGGKHINPICSSVMFNIVNDKVILRATNLEDSIETQIPLESTDLDGSFLVFGPQLLNFVKELDDETITLGLDDASSTLSVVSSNSEAVISLVPNEDFPAFPTVPDNGNLIPLPVGLFLEAIDKTGFSAASEHESRVLYGINLVLEGNTLKVTSSDGFRLSHFRSDIENHSGVGWSVVLPKRRAQDLKRILSMLFSKDEEVLMGHSGNHFYIGSKILSVFSRTIEEKYPDYESIIPKEYTRKAVLNRQQVVQAIKRVCLFSSQRSGGVKLQFDPEGKMLHLSSLRYSDEPFIGMAAESVDLLDSQGEPVTLGLNYRLVLECLAVLRGEEVVLDLGDSLWPVRFTSEDDKGFYHILMPIQLDEIESEKESD